MVLPRVDDPEIEEIIFVCVCVCVCVNADLKGIKKPPSSRFIGVRCPHLYWPREQSQCSQEISCKQMWEELELLTASSHSPSADTVCPGIPCTLEPF